ncbi:MAG TPA: hypothetical protein VFU55_06850 [Terracidiphilus sp.]|nr:hypothetical protein [Terracidiphilus sp.]
MSTRKHYFRAGQGLSGAGGGIMRARAAGLVPGAALAWVLAGLSAAALGQYPGQVQTKPSAPVLRAVAVYEWTGELSKPTFSRLVPVTIFDGQTLQDGGIYLARPAPLGLDSETEYVLEKDGRRVGLFDVEKAGRLQGAWMGFGKWKPMPRVKPKSRQQEFAKVDYVDESSDEPILHRKHHPGEAKSGGGEPGGDAGETSAGSAPAPDTDRPVLHRTGDDKTGDNKAGDDKTGEDRAGENNGANGTGQAGGAGSAGGTAAGSAPAPDPDQPTLTRPKKHKKEQAENDQAYVEDLPGISDTGRPRLMRGKPEDPGAVEAPELRGMPPDVHQMVAVSDATNRPEHLWSYTWSNADDEMKMKTELEAIARDALGLTPPPKLEPKTRKGRRRTKPAAQQLTLPAALEDEQFRVFELAYGSGATMVFSANTGGLLKDEKFVTLIAQPDLYGNVAILLKHVGDGAHLDDSPRMRLVDAVDAMADNRGELLFELRGASAREFALYRVLHGQAEKIFSSQPEWFGAGAGGAGADE